MKKISLFIFYYLIASTVFGQLRLDTSISAEELVLEHLLQKNSDVIISNVNFVGLSISKAAFTNESPGELMDAGVILSTGDVFDAMGPNDAMNTGIKASARRDMDLQAIATGVVTDAVVLEFDILALRDSISFTYVFASEEYPEFVDKGVNDVFGFFIHEVGGRAVRPLNIARLPVTREKVSIDNVNHRHNEKYFLRSDFLSAHDNDFWEKNKSMMMRARIFEFDGFTVPLKATAKLKTGKKYHFKIAIADVGDRYYDSGVLIKAQSFSAVGPRIESADSILMAEVKRKFNTSESFANTKEMSFSLLINFDVDKAIIPSESIKPLDDLIQLMNELPDLNATIVGHTDSDGEELRNQLLSERRANAVKNYLIANGVNANRLQAIGKGETEADSSNCTENGKARNRRVEFLLSY